MSFFSSSKKPATPAASTSSSSASNDDSKAAGGYLEIKTGGEVDGMSRIPSDCEVNAVTHA